MASIPRHFNPSTHSIRFLPMFLISFYYCAK
ncbi:CRISPR-associated DxTHG motif protein [Escherichia coli]|nr:CRISPR-associated DxTHG motif protein [Escherichia coli]EEW2303307.1 CRISPR-associated DxTHG motif protein [Escherichia coli]EFB3325259.1 CRISPR-associated DxTHG motif protein [Escherichia coli]MIC27858.1 CRISPR-associated DxTHG motif protein [Escherichia coli]